MYPKISDIINDLFGTHICLPIQSFGFFVALAFLAAFYVIRVEYKQKQALNMFYSYKVKVKEGGPIPFSDVITNFLVYALIGYKLGLLLMRYREYCEYPQELIASFEGSVWGAIILGLLGGGYKYYEFNKRRNEVVKVVEQEHSLYEESTTMFTLAFIFGILGAKLFHNIEYWDNFIKDPIGNLTSFDGLTFYGGLLCAGIVIMIYVYRKGYDLLTTTDATLPSVMLAYGIGRMGCHISGDGDWGRPNPHPNPGLPDWMWAYHYPHNVIKEGVPIANCVGNYCNQLADAVYPTALYECVMGILIFGILWSLRTKLPYLGQITGLYLMFNGLERFLIEKIRVNATIPFLGMQVTQAEIISSILFLGGVAVFVLSMFVWKRENKAYTAKAG